MDILIKNEEKPLLDEIVELVKKSDVQKQQLILTHIKAFDQGYIYGKMTKWHEEKEPA